MVKYETFGNIESEYEPGSNDKVLKNLLGITNKQEIEEQETLYLKKLESLAIHTYTEKHKFSCNDIKKMHSQWLVHIYSWAGKYRSVDLSKDSFVFAQVRFIDQLMAEYEKKFLGKYTPANQFKDIEALADSLAKVHVEFILIHPFREGNGRLGRILSNLMVLQAGRNWLDFSLMNYDEYIRAIHAGVDRNYKPMQKIFEQLMQQSD